MRRLLVAATLAATVTFAIGIASPAFADSDPTTRNKVAKRKIMRWQTTEEIKGSDRIDLMARIVREG